MTKTPDEIKKGLECCRNVLLGDHWKNCDSACPYQSEQCYCKNALHHDTIALIQQLEVDKQQLEGMLTHMNQLRDAAADRALKMEERVQQLEAERDAAVNFLRSMGCDTCMYDDYDGSEPPCINCTAERDYWMWRGVQKEE